MMFTKQLGDHAAAPIEHERARHFAAMALHAASRLLDRMASRLLVAHGAGQQGEPVLEFYAEAGALEGALYIDGQLVGRLPGVARL